MAVGHISPLKYGKLLAKTLPRVIESAEEFERCVAMMESLDRRSENGEILNPEEKALLALLEQLVKVYDDKVPLPEMPPHEMVTYLMEQRSLRQVDLVPVFGSRSVVSDVLAGRREPSKAHIKKLAEFFHVSPELFL